ncbi:hypothetical protein [Sporolactobacillus terrae]|uniref:ABC transporter permease n=1 Tax=Sporolactobacillus terrae TaxID=269673 RepID=A0ABX5QAK8_9BACL|nr:hypothetical protein [Sporolactobacillus terrae]QAA23704.1 hypothetical protein C0674_14505 [Sporolactobacillus terrae]QAA26675.1 hypothetical protein C0679_14490 [Sporolactobacillus terrae]UAK15743.1 hypothetical protein K7399_12040 [Sporolactobacillus terrae]
MKTVWFTLFKKELRLGWMAFVIFLILQLLLMALGVFLNFRYGDDGNVAPMVIGVMLTILLLFYVPVYLLFTVIQERKTFHIWMQNPLPGWSMLLAKLSGALVYFIGTTAIVGTYTWVSLMRITEMPQELSLFRITMLAVLILIWSGIGGGITFLFLWMVQRTMRSRIGKWAWIVLIVGIVVYSIIDGKFIESGAFAFLTDWGPIQNVSVLHFVMPDGAPTTLSTDFATADPIGLTVGDIVLDLVKTVIMFILAAWLTDHKLEAS